ncbi:MAG: HAD-IC family P-type ATPase, partial [Actinobacteria bacterium]|nr:HAD-IC family P-type ATPase [Actinomycetota bacterium]
MSTVENNNNYKKTEKLLLCHELSIEETINEYETGRNGISNEEALARQKKFGSNELPGKQVLSLWKIILHQFKSPLIYILIVAAAISLIIREFKDSAFIFMIILLNAFLGAFQEYRAEKSAASLQDFLKITVRVIREGKRTGIYAEELVPGDIVLISQGSKIPADLRLIEASNLTIDESLLTGESNPEEKHTGAVNEDVDISNCANIAFAGTRAITGKGIGVVTRTGMHTELGRIAKSVYTTESVKTPLVIRMEKFSKQIGFVVLGISLIIGIIMFFTGTPYIDIFLLITALAVSSIPEGLPVAITVALSISTNRMSKRNVIVRKLAAVESLGSCTLIASDKTGTLTVNRQSARLIVSSSGNSFIIKDEANAGKENPESNKINEKKQGCIEEFESIIAAAVIDNDAIITKGINKETKFDGNPIDTALLKLSQNCGLDPAKIRESVYTAGEIPFSSEFKFSAKIYKKEGSMMIAAKGAPEVIIPMCRNIRKNSSLQKIDATTLYKDTDKITAKGYRVIAIAEGILDENRHSSLLKKPDMKKLPPLTFLGLVGFIDPLRPDTASAVNECKDAGIKVVMITGDHPLTAGAIAKEIGIISDSKDVTVGKELNDLSLEKDKEFDGFIKDKKVFARVTPLQKLKIVEAFRRLGHFIAVTGDGINDAPALKKANIGVAMGSGTDVTKDTASIIITDDSFASIVSGIEEGRFAYDNIRKVTYLLLATGIAEIILFLITIILGLPLALLAVQLLWLNIVTNGIQDVALAFEKGEKDVLKRPPKKPVEGIFNRLMIQETMLSGAFMGIVAAAVWFFLISTGREVNEARNIILMLMVLFENFHVFNCRSEKESVFKIPVKNNYILIGGILAAQGLHLASMYIPFMQRLLNIAPL